MAELCRDIERGAVLRIRVSHAVGRATVNCRGQEVRRSKKGGVAATALGMKAKATSSQDRHIYISRRLMYSMMGT
jgi:hypothetical protein